MPEAARQQGPALFPSGVVCDRFRIDGVLGVGGTGTVFRALDLEREEVVALKAIPHDATLRQRARREASVASKLRHPNVVRLRSVHEDGQYVYIASDIVEGVDLAGALRQGQLGDAALLRVAAAVCAGLAHAHEHGVVHRDVKPANVLLGRDGSVRVLDFGIATLDEPDATVDDRMLGTLSYMAPEACLGGRPAPATDVWAVGVMVYEALTGANPYRARTPDELRERHRHPPRSLADLRPELPRSLAVACARALQSHPRRRPSAEAFGRVLSAAADAIERPGQRQPRATGRRRAARPARALPSLPGRPSLPALPRLSALPRPQIDVVLGTWGEGAMTLGAVVTAIKRQVSRKSGAEFARLTVEDFSGSSEVLVFPEAWSALSDRVRTDVPMLIKGGYSRRDQGAENPTFIVEAIQRFEELRVSGQIAVSLEIEAVPSAATGNGSPLVGTAEALDSGVFRDVRAVIDAHPGSAPLHVKWSDSTGNVARLRSRSLKLAASHAALTELRALLGQERVRLVKGGGS